MIKKILEFITGIPDDGSLDAVVVVFISFGIASAMVIVPLLIIGLPVIIMR